MQHEGDL